MCILYKYRSTTNIMTPYHSSLCPTFRCKTDVDALKTAYNTLHQTQEMLNHTSAKLTSVMDHPVHSRSAKAYFKPYLDLFLAFPDLIK